MTVWSSCVCIGEFHTQEIIQFVESGGVNSQDIIEESVEDEAGAGSVDSVEEEQRSITDGQTEEKRWWDMTGWFADSSSGVVDDDVMIDHDDAGETNQLHVYEYPEDLGSHAEDYLDRADL